MLRFLTSWIKNSSPVCWLRKKYRAKFRKLEDHGFSWDDPLGFAIKSRGVVHVGANEGQEAWIYGMMGKPVLWFEPLPIPFKVLQTNVQQYRNQRCIQALLTDIPDQIIEFNTSSNNGRSSSIFPLAEHKRMFPDVQYVDKLQLVTSTLKSHLTTLDPAQNFDALVLDVQGAELLVLKGAEDRLRQFRWILAESADFELYQGGCTRRQLDDWLIGSGYKIRKVHCNTTTEGVGTVFDVLYEKI